MLTPIKKVTKYSRRLNVKVIINHKKAARIKTRGYHNMEVAEVSFWQQSLAVPPRRHAALQMSSGEKGPDSINGEKPRRPCARDFADTRRRTRQTSLTSGVEFISRF